MPNLNQNHLFCQRNLLTDTRVLLRHIHPSMAYIAHCLKNLVSLLLRKPLKLIIKNWSKDPGHTQHSPEMPNKEFQTEAAVEQCKSRCWTDSQQAPLITHIRGRVFCEYR